MNLIKIEFKGLDEIVRKMKTLENAKDIEQRALTEGAEFIRKKISDNAPVDKGELKMNIVKTTVKNGLISIGTEPKGDGFYGYFHEIGTSKLLANPFVRPTFEANKDKIQEIMAAEIKKGLKL